MLQDGVVSAVPGERVLLVSDLDDTMIGDDSGSAAFKRFWEREAVPRGSRLVYNTGRALEQCATCHPFSWGGHKNARIHKFRAYRQSAHT